MTTLNTFLKGNQDTNPLYTLRPLFQPLITNFQESYTRNRELSIDEAMIGFKGRLSFIQYLPKKPTKWGMKAYVLADSSTGYIYNWRLCSVHVCAYIRYVLYTCICVHRAYTHRSTYRNTSYHTSFTCIILAVYNHVHTHVCTCITFVQAQGRANATCKYTLCSGKDETLQLRRRNHTHAVVVTLLQGLGHHAHTDNYYSSPDLFGELRDLGFGACGTIQINQRGLPPAMKANLSRGDVSASIMDE